MIKFINTQKAPSAIGPYSQATVAGNMIYTSGQIAIDPMKSEFKNESIEIQTKQVIENLKAILEAAGSSLQNVVKTTVFITDMNNFAAVNSIYAQYFTAKPARSTVAVKDLPKSALIEIECVAVLN